MRTAILFDLDGTLLPMDLERFTKGYFGLLTAEMAKHGYDPQLLVKALLSGIGAMGKGDGTVTCEQLFWDDAKRILGDGCIRDIPFFDAFYKDGFRGAKRFTEPDPAHSRAAVAAAHESSPIVALATNPLFPFSAIEERLDWVGLTPADFDLVTSYETSHFAKPSPKYFAEVAKKLGVDPKDCLMIGNDVREDILPATSTGMETVLVTDCMLHAEGAEYRTVTTAFCDLAATIRSVCGK